jgi:cation diffusion facilitator CzcD-associated flavoprotein CzcO
MESLDLVVIGAGWSGLVAAKTYLEVKPSSKVIVLDSESSVGGVWTKHRLYKGQIQQYAWDLRIH